MLEKYRLLTTAPMPSLPNLTTRRSTDNITSSQLHHSVSMSNLPRSPANSSAKRAVIEKYHSGDSTGKEQAVRPSSTSPVEGHLPPSPALAQGFSTTAASELVWLTEMEKGYDTLVDAIYPYISDVVVLSLGRTIDRSVGTDSNTF